ncbi:hypothetical protein ACSBR1_039925 [Camellia fascicularis]
MKRENFEEWVLAAVYASPNPGIHQNLWNELENISSPMNYRCRKFLDNINRCGLMDIGCSGPKFTWSNNRQGMANTMERLDRALCNAEWRTAFPEGAV